VVVNAVLKGKGNYGFNAANDTYGDMLEMGILDPTKVTRTALQNAASVASLMLTTECMIAEAPRRRRWCSRHGRAAWAAWAAWACNCLLAAARRVEPRLCPVPDRHNPHAARRVFSCPRPSPLPWVHLQHSRCLGLPLPHTWVQTFPDF
jgi:hypothetical protein